MKKTIDEDFKRAEGSNNVEIMKFCQKKMNELRDTPAYRRYEAWQSQNTSS